MGVDSGAFDVGATGDRAGSHLVRVVALVSAVHRSVFTRLCDALLCGMMIPVNGAAVSGAASAGKSHQCGAGHRRINEQQR